MRKNLKSLLGAMLCRALPRRVAEIRREFTLPYWSATVGRTRIDRLIRAHIATQASADGTGRTLETLHRGFWSAQADSGWYRATEARFEREFRDVIERYLDWLQPLLRERGIRTVCEIGTGNGYCLNFLREHLQGPLEFIGLDLAARQIECNRLRFPALRFECADAMSWIREHDAGPTPYLTVGGVFEYFRRKAIEELLRCIGARPHPCLLMPLFEPVATGHDLEIDPRSHVYGSEFSFSHNYPALLREAGWRVVFRDDTPPVTGRAISLCAASPAWERSAQSVQ